MDAGVIEHLSRQVPYPIYWPGHDGDKNWLLFTYISDFEYDVNGEHVVEDVKGRVLNEFRLKKKGVKFAHGRDIAIVTRKRMTWYFNGKAEERSYL